MKMTKKVLRLTVAIYLILLLLMSEGGHHDLAMLVKMCAIALGLVACGSGASKVSVGIVRPTGTIWIVIS